jgi:hypothetical protein
MSNIVFPLDIAGAMPNLKRVPIFATGIQTSSNGSELRASWQSWPRYKYQLQIEVLRSDLVNLEFQRIASSLSSVLGMYDTFLIVDPNDSVALNHGFAVTDGSSTGYQLQRTLGGVRQVNLWDTQTYPIYSTQRANLLLQSQAFDNVGWIKSSCTVGVNADVAPDGTVTADSIIESTASSIQHYLEQIVTVPAAAAQYTFSCYVKPGARGWVVLQMNETTGGGFVNAYFNLATGAVGTQVVGSNWSGISTRIQVSNSGWYRLSITSTKTNAATTIQTFVLPSLTNTTDTYAGTVSTVATYVWGAQLETAAAPTAYMPTTSAAVSVNPKFWPNFGDGFEPVVDINPGTLKVYLNGALQTPGSAYNYSGAGLVTFTSAPGGNQALTWSGNYYRRVRFDSDEVSIDRIFGQFWESKQIDFISIK